MYTLKREDTAGVRRQERITYSSYVQKNFQTRKKKEVATRGPSNWASNTHQPKPLYS